jgi:6-phospho-beta-glucosidase
VRVGLEEDIREALRGASFVITQIRVGKNETRARDENFVKSLGLTAQETTGAVGFLKAYRTIPVMVEIAGQIQEICPDAFLINFTNPAGLVSTAVAGATGKKNVAGLCNVPLFVKKSLLRIVKEYNLQNVPLSGGDLNADSVEMTWGGLNHLSWLFDFRINGKSCLDEILNVITDDSFDPAGFYFSGRDYMRRTRAIPSPYLRYFTDTEKMIREQSLIPVRGEEVLKIEKELLQAYRNETRRIRPGSLPPLPESLSLRGGADYSRMAVQLMADLAGRNGGSTHILNVPDAGERFGPASHFVEVPVRLQKTGQDGGLECLYPGEDLIAPEIEELIKRMTRWEILAVEAGLSQDRGLALEALSTHPLTGDRDKAKQMMPLIDKYPDLCS